MKKLLLGCVFTLSILALGACVAHRDHQHHSSHKKETNNMPIATVLEIASFKLAAGVSPAEFYTLDKAVEIEHVSQQTGFISRTSSFSEDGEWMVVVYWKDLASADASMQSFANAPAAAGFMENLQMESMSMKRYTINQ